MLSTSCQDSLDSHLHGASIGLLPESVGYSLGSCGTPGTFGHPKRPEPFMVHTSDQVVTSSEWALSGWVMSLFSGSGG